MSDAHEHALDIDRRKLSALRVDRRKRSVVDLPTRRLQQLAGCTTLHRLLVYWGQADAQYVRTLASRTEGPEKLGRPSERCA